MGLLLLIIFILLVLGAFPALQQKLGLLAQRNARPDPDNCLDSAAPGQNLSRSQAEGQEHLGICA